MTIPSHHAASPPMRLAGYLRRHPVIAAAALAWAAANAMVLLLAGGVLPFDRPALILMPFALQVALPTLGLVQLLLLALVTWWLTRDRVRPDWPARAPDRARALREAGALMAYAMAAQADGWIVGPLMGYRPFSFHVAGTLVGCSVSPTGGEMLVWAGYNFVMFALVPWLWFRRRYTPMQLGLRSIDRRNDLLVIVVIAVLETATELSSFPGLFALDAGEMIVGLPLAFAVFFLGTVLPTMILIYAILLPRYLAITGSWPATIVLGGLTYAVMHLVEGWSSFASGTDTALSLLFVFLTYFGPGMFKSYLTLRTGNAWVHAFGYHIVAPHMVVDAPLVLRAFALR